MTSFLKSTGTELLFFAVTATLFTLQAKRAAGSDATGATCKAGELRNSAFVFVKPHANTPAVQKLVREKLVAAGCTILSEKDIDGKTIDEQKLIDQHYYAIGMYYCNTVANVTCRSLLASLHSSHSFIHAYTIPVLIIDNNMMSLLKPTIYLSFESHNPPCQRYSGPQRQVPGGLWRILGHGLERGPCQQRPGRLCHVQMRFRRSQ